MDLLKDGVGGGRPHEGPGAGVVVVLREAEDLLPELLDRREGAAADGLAGDDAEPDLDLVEPGGVGGGEVDVVARAGGEPALRRPPTNRWPS